MFRKMVTASKLLLTQRALIGFDPRMGAAVAGQLVRTREPPSTVRPATCVWFFSGVTTEVRFQVAALGVHLSTARVGALMDPLCSGHSGHARRYSFQHTISLASYPRYTCDLNSPHGDGQGGNLYILLVGCLGVSVVKRYQCGCCCSGRRHLRCKKSDILSGSTLEAHYQVGKPYATGGTRRRCRRSLGLGQGYRLYLQDQGSP